MPRYLMEKSTNWRGNNNVAEGHLVLVAADRGKLAFTHITS
jgi:hypothetical protein